MNIRMDHSEPDQKPVAKPRKKKKEKKVKQNLMKSFGSLKDLDGIDEDLLDDYLVEEE